MPYGNTPYAAGRPTGPNFRPGGMSSGPVNMALNAADRVGGPGTRMQLENTLDNLAQCAYDDVALIAVLS